MDEAPNCAICNAPAYPECPCESERLQIAVKQAEQRAMDERLAEIRCASCYRCKISSADCVSETGSSTMHASISSRLSKASLLFANKRTPHTLLRCQTTIYTCGTQVDRQFRTFMLPRYSHKLPKHMRSSSGVSMSTGVHQFFDTQQY
jgi:hypothetical protein